MPVRLPLLSGLHFRLARKWRTSDIWLMLYRHQRRYRH
jgi:hypothetical protein